MSLRYRCGHVPILVLMFASQWMRFATHFLTVADQEKSKDFHVRILGGKVVKPKDPCYL